MLSLPCTYFVKGCRGVNVINRVKLADAIRYVEYQIKDTEYFMIEPISFLKEAIKERKVIPLFYFDGHATITEAYRTKFKDIRQTMRLSGYFTAPHSLQEHEGTLTNYGFELDKTHITISQAIVYDLDFIDVIQFTAPFQKGEFIEPSFHDHIQIKRNDIVSLYVHKPFLDDMKMYYASDSNPRTIYDKIEVKTEDLHFELSHLKALFSLKGDKIPAPTVTQTQPPNNEQLIKELAAAKAEIADLKNQLEQAKAKLADKPADDLKDVPHQSYRTVARVMYAMAQLAKVDNSKPFSQNKPSLNASITTILQNDGVPLESEAVGKWLSRINDIKPLK